MTTQFPKTQFTTRDYTSPTPKPKSWFNLPPCIKKTVNVLKGVDGFDEMAVAGAAYLPKVWQPTAVCTSLSLCSPLVLMGAMGMASDIQEEYNNAQHLKDSNVDLALKLLLSKDLTTDMKTKIEADFEKNNEKNARHLKILNNVLNSIDTDSPSNTVNTVLEKLNIKVSNPEDTNTVVKELNAYHTQLKNKKALKTALDKNDNTGEIFAKTLKITPISKETLDSAIIHYKDNQEKISQANNVITTQLPNYLGNTAMFGMTLGTATAALKAGTEVMQQFGILPTIMPKVTDGLEFGANSIFNVSQMAMIGYGLGQAYKGYTQYQDLKKQKEFLGNSNIDDEHKTHAINHINQLQTYNTLSNAVYGVGIAAAEAGMIAGNLTGSSPLLLASSLGTLGFAITRIVAQSYENALKGDDHDHEHDGSPIRMLNPWKKPETHLSDTNNNTTPGCPKKGCTTEHDAFDLDSVKVNEKYQDNMIHLNALHAQIDFIKNHPLNSKGVKASKHVLEFVTDKKFNLIDALLENSDAKEYVKNILIKELKNDENNKASSLTELRKEEDDENTEALKAIFKNNQDIINKPEYAKRIFIPLLTDALNVQTQKKHHLIENMIHIAKIEAEKAAKKK